MIRSFLQSVGYAVNGLIIGIRFERNIQIQVAIALEVVALGWCVGLSTMEWCIVLGCIALITGMELINTAIEKLVDLVQPNQDNRAGRIKDIAAGAVLCCAIVSVIIGLLIFIPKLF